MSRRLVLNWRVLALLLSAMLAPGSGHRRGAGRQLLWRPLVEHGEPRVAQLRKQRGAAAEPQHGAAARSAASAGPGAAGSRSAYGGGSFFQRHPFLTGLAGGLFGSWLFGHSGYAAGAEGHSAGSMFGTLLQILIIGLLIYFVVRLFRGRALSNGWRGGARLPAALGRGGRGPGPSGSTAGGTSMSAMTTCSASRRSMPRCRRRGARAMSRMRRLMTPEMLGYFSEELTRSASQGVRNVVANVELLKGDLGESWEEGDMQYATAYMRWRASDYVARSDSSPGDPGYLVSGDPRQPVEAEEVWTFVRRHGGDWLLSAIQQV